MNNSGATLFFNVHTAMEHLSDVRIWLAEQGITPLDDNPNKPAYIANLIAYHNDSGIGEIEFLFYNVEDSFRTWFVLRWGNQKIKNNDI